MTRLDRMRGLATVLVTVSVASFAGPSLALSDPQDEGSVFGPPTSEDPRVEDFPAGGSKVYYPDAITPESVAEARERAAVQERLEAQRKMAIETSGDLPQVAAQDDRSTSLVQLTDESVRRALSQLTEAEREVVLEAITGTDICDDPPAVDAILKLCESRIETRSQEFAVQSANRLTPEERLLGEGLEDTGTPSLADVIERLAGNAGRPDDPNNQAIASVALRQQAPVEERTQNENANSEQLSPETQQFINALVQQIGSPGNR